MLHVGENWYSYATAIFTSIPLIYGSIKKHHDLVIAIFLKLHDLEITKKVEKSKSPFADPNYTHSLLEFNWLSLKKIKQICGRETLQKLPVFCFFSCTENEPPIFCLRNVFPKFWSRERLVFTYLN